MQSNRNSMVLGSFIGDSLALGAHWIYNTNKIESEVGEVNTLLPPVKNSYHKNKEIGNFTNYEDQSFHLLEFLTENDGIVDS